MRSATVCIATVYGGAVRVRIKETPQEREIDGVKLDGLTPGTVRDVSPSIGSWLVAEGYAEVEMRHAPRDGEEELNRDGVNDPRSVTDRRRHRRKS